MCLWVSRWKYLLSHKLVSKTYLHDVMKYHDVMIVGSS